MLDVVSNSCLKIMLASLGASLGAFLGDSSYAWPILRQDEGAREPPPKTLKGLIGSSWPRDESRGLT